MCLRPSGPRGRPSAVVFLPGVPYDRLSPFGAGPQDQNIQVAARLDLAKGIGLWSLLDKVYSQAVQLHERGFAHGDLFLHNVIVSPAPVSPHLIDFELAVRREDVADEAAWEERCEKDLEEVLREGLYLQCALGRQQGALAEALEAALERLVDDPERFQRAIDRQLPKA